MKSVTFSEVVRANDRSRLLNPVRSWRQLALFGVTLAIGLSLLMLVLHLVKPATPLAWIVLPVLAGGLLPVFAAVPGRFEVSTRFDARHMVGTLDETLGSLGFAPAAHAPGAVRYRSRDAGWRGWGSAEVAVTVREHALEVVGPIDTLRALQQRLAR
jgi:hypothetical protein